MQTAEFIHLLETHPKRNLSFEYAPGKYVRADYHVTEVKNVHIESTDCGGRQDSWKETVVQLWANPEMEEPDHRLTSNKVLDIMKRVASLQPLMKNTPVKIEYGDRDFHTAQLNITGHRLENNQLIVSLGVEHTTCKAKDLCGIPAESGRDVQECTPGSGCC
jgi:hypothetical protein